MTQKLREEEIELRSIYTPEVIGTYLTNRNAGTFLNTYLAIPALRRALGDLKGKRLLDIGCGFGEDLRWYQSQGADIHGVDINPEFLRIAQLDMPHIGIREGSIYDLEAHKSFDVCTANLVLDQVADIESALRQVHESLKPGGHFVFSVVHPFNSGTCDYRKDLDYFGKRKDYYQPRSLGRFLPFYHRTFGDYFALASRTGFQIANLIEARPVPEAEVFFSEQFRLCAKQPKILILDLLKVANNH